MRSFLFYCQVRCIILLTLFLNKRVTIKKDNPDYLYLSPFLSHACSTPLSIIMCNLEVLLQSENTHNRTLLENIGSATKRLSYLLHSQKRTKRFSVISAITEIVSLVKSKYKATIVTSYSAVNISLKGNRVIFQEALLCLLTNAIEAYEQISERSLVIIIVKVTKKTVIITIQDFGAGMNAIACRAAYISGVSYKRTGSGVGLPFSHKVISELFNGSLTIESGENKGTRVTVTVPVSSVRNTQTLLPFLSLKSSTAT